MTDVNASNGPGAGASSAVSGSAGSAPSAPQSVEAEAKSIVDANTTVASSGPNAGRAVVDTKGIAQSLGEARRADPERGRAVGNAVASQLDAAAQGRLASDQRAAQNAGAIANQMNAEAAMGRATMTAAADATRTAAVAQAQAAASTAHAREMSETRAQVRDAMTDAPGRAPTEAEVSRAARRSASWPGETAPTVTPPTAGEALAARHATEVSAGWFGATRTDYATGEIAGEILSAKAADPARGARLQAETLEALPDVEANAVKKEIERREATIAVESREGLDVLYARATGQGRFAPDGTRLEGELAGGMMQSRSVHQTTILGVPVGAAHTSDVMNGVLKGEHGTTPYGSGTKLEGRTQMLSATGSVFVGPDADNPYVQLTGGFDLMQADAKLDTLVGHDGKRTGLVVELEAGARAARAGGSVEVNTPLGHVVPFSEYVFGTDKTVSLRIAADVEAGGAGAGVGGGGFYDHETGRFQVNVSALASWIVGADVQATLSVGNAFANRER